MVLANGTYEVDPVSRIEGHLGVKVTTSGGVITDAKAHGNLWRGFENFLLGRDVNDAITFTQRICGVCPVPHGLASTHCVDTVLGYSKGHITFKFDGTHGIPEKALLIRNLVLGAEFLMSSITHFYHLAAPSYVQGPNMPPWTPYFADNLYSSYLRSGGEAVPDTNAGTMKLWDAVILSYVKALKIRRLTFEAGALFAGRMPMTSCFVGGGVTNEGTEDLSAKVVKYRELIQTVGRFIVNEYVPIALALGVLYQGFDSQTMPLVAGSTTTMKANNRGYGGGIGRFLSWGAFPTLTNTLGLPGGVKTTIGTDPVGTEFSVATKALVESEFLTATSANAVTKCLTEDVSNSRYDVYADDAAKYASSATRPYASASAAFPGDNTRTKPNRAKGYTYMKAPRWKGLPVEVGPLARLAVAGIYPVNGTTLTAIPGYKEIYTVNGDGTGGLDLRPQVVAAEIKNGLVNDGIAGIVESWILDLKGGLSTMDRLRARALESLVLVQMLVGSISKNVGTGAISFASDGMIDQLAARTGGANDTAGSTWRDKTLPVGTVFGWGATEAPRGALMHQATITNGKIVSYQAIVPTTWNGSPAVGATTAGSRDNRGAIEAACIDVPFADDTKDITSQNGTDTITTFAGVEVLRVAQSFDPCIACAVH